MRCCSVPSSRPLQPHCPKYRKATCQLKSPRNTRERVDPSAAPILTFAEFISRPATEWERPTQHFPTVECLSQAWK